MAVPAKILLKSSTKMSLNERFSKLPAPHTTDAIRAAAAADAQASVKNRRLALQMENRPSVKAALGQSVSPVINRPLQTMPQQQNRLSTQLSRPTVQQRISPKPVPIQNRIGRPNIKARLTLPPSSRGVLKGQIRGQMKGYTRGVGFRGSLQNTTGRSRGRGGLTRGYYTFTQRGRGLNRGNRGGRGFMRGSRGTWNNTRNTRGNRFMRGRARGRGNRPKLSSDALDTQLDEYMSKTKAHLDAELDAYMAESTN